VSAEKQAEAPKSSAPEPAAAPAAKKPKARGLVKWPMVVIVVGGAAAFAFAGVAPTAKWAVQKYGSSALGAPVLVGRASFDPTKLTLVLGDVVAMDPASGAKNGNDTKFDRELFSAKEVVAAVDLGATLRGQLVLDEVRITGGRGKAVRGKDGSINVAGPANAPAPPPGTSPDDPAWRRKIEEQAKKRDLVKDLQDLLKKLREKHEEKVAQRKAEEERRREEGVGDPLARSAGYRDPRPAILVRKLVADDLEIQVTDDAAGAKPAVISKARVEVTNLSSAPDLVPEPVAVTTKFEAAPAVLDALFKNTIPVSFGDKTTTAVDSALSFKSQDWSIDWKPILSLANIDARAREPGAKILGIDAKQFADALTDVQTLDLRDVHIFGEAWEPNVELGDTLKNVVVEALKKKGQKAAAAEIEKGIAKVGDKIDPNLKKKIADSPAGDVLKKGQDAVGDKLKGLGDSLFGGDKKGN
jgi:hypothetical protein